MLAFAIAINSVFLFYQFLIISILGTVRAEPLGPSIYEVHTEGARGSGSGGRMWTGGPAPCRRPHRKLKLESTDVILSSSHAKKLASFLQEFRLWTEKVEICLRYKLVI